MSAQQLLATWLTGKVRAKKALKAVKSCSEDHMNDALFESDEASAGVSGRCPRGSA